MATNLLTFLQLLVLLPKCDWRRKTYHSKHFSSITLLWNVRNSWRKFKDLRLIVIARSCLIKQKIIFQVIWKLYVEMAIYLMASSFLDLYFHILMKFYLWLFHVLVITYIHTSLNYHLAQPKTFSWSQWYMNIRFKF